jgi:hypothetical protein
MKQFYVLIFSLFISGLSFGQITISGSVGIDGTYANLTNAGGAFAAINGTSQGGANIVISVSNDVSNEDGATALNEGEWTSLSIKSDAAVVRTIIGNSTIGLIRLNGADRVTVDGSFDGSGMFLYFINTNNPAGTGSVFTFLNGATNNTLTNLFLQSITGSTTGQILFSNTTSVGNSNNTVSNCNIRASNGSSLGNVCVYSAGTSGNENMNNTFTNNYLYEFGFRAFDITATGSTGWTITGNSIFSGGVNYGTGSANIHGIRIQGGGNYTITGNYIGTNAPLASGSNISFSSTAALVTFNGIDLTLTTGISNVKGNIIRGINVNCTPTAASSVAFVGISAGGAGQANIGGPLVNEGNIIGSNTLNSSIIITTTTASATPTSQFRGISSFGAGNLIMGNQIGGLDINNIGTTPASTSVFGILSGGTAIAPPMVISNNIIGSNGAGAATNSIRYLSTSSATPSFTLIQHQAVSAVNITNNFIRNLSVQTSVSSGSLTGINITSSTVNAVNITNNIISDINSVNNSATTAGTYTGIISNASASANTTNITNNIISNINQAGTNTTAVLRGITQSGTSSHDIANNTIHNLSCSGSFAGLANATLPLMGIFKNGGNVSGSATINDNKIYNLSLTNTGAIGNGVAGIVLTLSTINPSVSVEIRRNHIYGLSNASTSTTLGATTTPFAAGIYFRQPTAGANVLVANNEISLGTGQTNNTVFMGIWHGPASSTAFATLNVFYNSVHIGGSVTSGALPSYAFMRGDFGLVGATSPVVLRNNIFHNNRTGGTTKNYAIANYATTPSTSGWGATATNYNNLFSSNIAAVGQWGTTDQTIDSWKTDSGGDANSVSSAIVFTDPLTGNLLPTGGLNCALDNTGIPITTATSFIVDVLTDINVLSRNSTTPDIGAYEFTNILVGPSVTNEQVATKVSDLLPQGVNINWYMSETGGIPMNLNAAVLEGNTYYISQTINTCESIRTPVLIVATLGVNEFETASFKYYPNPVTDSMTLSYTSQISSIEVFNLLGKKVLYLTPKSNTAKLDMNNLPIGVYILKLTSEGKIRVVRVVKK